MSIFSLVGFSWIVGNNADNSSMCVLVSHVRLFGILWTVTHQAPLPMGFSGQEYQSVLSFPSLGDLRAPGIEPGFPALQPVSLPSEPQGKSNSSI